MCTLGSIDNAMKITKRLEWDEEKNQQLQQERDLSFEAIQLAIENGKLLDILPHPKEKYAHQKMLIVELNHYIVVVPCVEEEEKIFLKTAFCNRELQKVYLGDK
jgi:uncharacterized DUF497 family protein